MSIDKNRSMMVGMMITGAAPLIAAQVVNHELFKKAQKTAVELDAMVDDFIDKLRAKQTEARTAWEDCMSAEGIEAALVDLADADTPSSDVPEHPAVAAVTHKDQGSAT